MGIDRFGIDVFTFFLGKGMHNKIPFLVAETANDVLIDLQLTFLVFGVHQNKYN